MGLTTKEQPNGAKRLEVDAANARARGFPQAAASRQATLTFVWTAIARHTTPA